ncbi:MAG: hypothetical protein WC437_05620 [Patescibacteria group bacterium]|jgi:hypothetical protein
MTDINPTKNYVYQPLPDDRKLNPKIYSVGGPDVPYPRPGSWTMLTKSEAEKIVDELNKKHNRV